MFLSFPYVNNKYYTSILMQSISANEFYTCKKRAWVIMEKRLSHGVSENNVNKHRSILSLSFPYVNTITHLCNRLALLNIIESVHFSLTTDSWITYTCKERAWAWWVIMEKWRRSDSDPEWGEDSRVTWWGMERFDWVMVFLGHINMHKLALNGAFWLEKFSIHVRSRFWKP